MTTRTPPDRTDDLSAPPTIREQVTDCARRLLVLVEADSNLVAHARRELANIDAGDDDL